MERTYFNTKELAKYIGRTEKAVRSLCMRRAIPFRKPGGRLLFLKDEVDRWVESSGGLTLSELEHSVK